MNYNDYIKGVSFSFMGPNRYFRGFNSLNKRLNKFNISLEVMNTKLPEGRKVMKENLRELLKIPRLSTFAIGAMINKGVASMSNNCCFVNVGVWHGFTFLAGIINNPNKRCIGVDNFSQLGAPREQFIKRYNIHKSPRHHFYDVDYKEYFLNIHTGKIGFYMYDGDHSYENQLEGLRIVEPFFSEDCVILVDDTNWVEPRQATIDFIAKSSYRYQILLDETTLFINHPTLWNGIMILQRIK